MTDWRDPSEREQLVERLIAAEHRADLAEATLKDLAEHEGDRSLAHMLLLYRARIAVFEENQKRLLNERGRQAA